MRNCDPTPSARSVVVVAAVADGDVGLEDAVEAVVVVAAPPVDGPTPPSRRRPEAP